MFHWNKHKNTRLDFDSQLYFHSLNTLLLFKIFFSKKQKFKLAKTFANRRKTKDTQRQLYLQHVSQDTKLRKITYRYKKKQNFSIIITNKLQNDYLTIIAPR